MSHDVSLTELLRRAEIEAPVADVSVSDVTFDSRHVRPGSLFVRFADDERAAAHTADAVLRGASVIASASCVAVPEGVVRVPLRDPRCDGGRIAAAFHGDPTRRLPVVGVTGTNGKTTTTYVLESIAAAAGRGCGVLGTIRWRTGASDRAAPLTTPPADALQRSFAEMLGAGRELAAIEVSSHALVQHRLSGTRLAAAVITNITRDHLDYHGDVAAYRAAKARIADHVAPGGCLILNADDDGVRAVADSFPSDLRVLTFSSRRNPAADLRADVVRMTPAGMRLVLRNRDQALALDTRLVGIHNADNVCAAVLAASALGIDLETAARGVERLSGVLGRLDPVDVGGEMSVFVDYAHTPDAFEKVLASVRVLASRRVICVFGCGGDRDRGKRPAMGRIAECLADAVFVTTDNPRNEDPRTIAEEIRSGMRDPSRSTWIEDREEAVRTALDAARPGDVVLVAGKGHETVQITRGGEFPHDDRLVVRRWADERAIGSGASSS